MNVSDIELNVLRELWHLYFRDEDSEILLDDLIACIRSVGGDESEVLHFLLNYGFVFPRQHDCHGQWYRISGRVGEFVRENERKDENSQGADSADNQKKNNVPQPKNVDVADLCRRLAKECGKGKSEAQIARDFCKGTKLKPKNLLRQARRFPHLWKR